MAEVGLGRTDRNELDDAVKVGANCVRLLGNTHVVTSNVIGRPLYLERWSQFLQYTKTLPIMGLPLREATVPTGVIPNSRMRKIFSAAGLTFSPNTTMSLV